MYKLVPILMLARQYYNFVVGENAEGKVCNPVVHVFLYQYRETDRILIRLVFLFMTYLSSQVDCISRISSCASYSIVWSLAIPVIAYTGTKDFIILYTGDPVIVIKCAIHNRRHDGRASILE